ncbi:hypothetical protein TNIN_392951 [Trichonephila inaurata madagascariensis]|uniref:Uncharacterized protein n=1 Tax=Trichonephila inaurata madagascariensis TaxID=2747483 RepID=A0A8X6X249_9ARAC|nr:hypothetical protein TNIN_392951 [Trichonephila inaurata madagascariensis]
MSDVAKDTSYETRGPLYFSVANGWDPGADGAGFGRETRYRISARMQFNDLEPTSSRGESGDHALSNPVHQIILVWACQSEITAFDKSALSFAGLLFQVFVNTSAGSKYANDSERRKLGGQDLATAVASAPQDPPYRWV